MKITRIFVKFLLGLFIVNLISIPFMWYFNFYKLYGIYSLIFLIVIMSILYLRKNILRIKNESNLEKEEKKRQIEENIKKLEQEALFMNAKRDIMDNVKGGLNQMEDERLENNSEEQIEDLEIKRKRGRPPLNNPYNTKKQVLTQEELARRYEEQQKSYEEERAKLNKKEETTEEQDYETPETEKIDKKGNIEDKPKEETANLISVLQSFEQRITNIEAALMRRMGLQ